MNDALTELQVLASKGSSLRDRLKRRREVIGTLISQNSESLTTIETQKDLENSENSEKNNKHFRGETSNETSESYSVCKSFHFSNMSTNSNPSVESTHSAHEISEPVSNSVYSLLSAPSAKEKEDNKQRDEILELLGKKTAKEMSLMDTFQSGGGVKEFCSYSTKSECSKYNPKKSSSIRIHCDKLHFAKIIQKHTDESLGDCSFLNTCFHMESCKYIHYKVDDEGGEEELGSQNSGIKKTNLLHSVKLVAPQWIQCDLRNLKLSVLGKFSVIMADPPWDIHMELPYGTLSDDEMRQLPVPSLQDDGLLFLWVTGRAMEMGRECLKYWGYERVDELIWVKTNQLQRIIRTGRTGHWLNHGKEHCLVGMKGHLSLNRGLDVDVIVAEVRATSHKPDEIYGLIERLSPGTRKIELFGRPHNVQPNWVTLGNQLDGIVIHDDEMRERFNESYPHGYELVPGYKIIPRTLP